MRVNGKAKAVEAADVNEAADVTEKESSKKIVWETDKKLDTPMPEGFSFDTYRTIHRKVFQFNYIFLQHKAEFLKYQAAKFNASATELIRQADEEQKFDPAVRVKVKKAERIAKSLATLKAELGEAGIDVEALLASMAAAKAAK